MSKSTCGTIREQKRGEGGPLEMSGGPGLNPQFTFDGICTAENFRPQKSLCWVCFCIKGGVYAFIKLLLG